MKFFVNLILFLNLIALVSCEKLATDVDAPKVETQLALFGFISPEEDYTRVQLTLSQPVFGTQQGANPFEYITDAAVTISNDGGQMAILEYADSVQAYIVSKSNFPIEPSRTYTITAISGSKTVSSSCTVPRDTIGFTDVTFKRTGEPGQSEGPLFRYQYKWNDIPGGANYYRVVSQMIYDIGGGSYHAQDICNTMSTDEGKDGGVLNGICEDYNSYFMEDTSNNRVSFFLLNTDLHYYEYHRRRLEYYGDDPFSEPFPQYTNVEGGLGVFCAYRKTVRKIKVF